MTNDKLTLLERRTLEAQAIAPVIRAFSGTGHTTLICPNAREN